MAIKTMYCCDVCGKIVERREDLTQISSQVKFIFTESLDEKFRQEIKNKGFVTITNARQYVEECGYEKYLGKIISIELNDDNIYQVMVIPKRQHKILKTIDLCDECRMERLPEIFGRREEDDH